MIYSLFDLLNYLTNNPKIFIYIACLIMLIISYVVARHQIKKKNKLIEKQKEESKDDSPYAKRAHYQGEPLSKQTIIPSVSYDCIILAAGSGSRIKDLGPKPLVKLNSKEMIKYSLDLASCLDCENIYVVTREDNLEINDYLSSLNVQLLYQKDKKGSGAALEPYINLNRNTDYLLVLPCDMPLLSKRSIKALIDKASIESLDLCFLEATLDNPKDYGRVIRDSLGKINKINEESWLENGQENIKNVSCFVNFIKSKKLKSEYSKLDCNNPKGEYSLTDLCEIFIKDDLLVDSYITKNQKEVFGVNSLTDLNKIKDIMEE